MKTKTKQHLVNIEKEIETKIEQFNTLTSQYYALGKKILQDIIDLRRNQNPDYNFCTLSTEKGLEQHAGKIKDIFKYDNINEKTLELQEEGKLSKGDAFLLAQLPNYLLRGNNQNKIVNLLIDKKIDSRDILEDSLKLHQLLGDDPAQIRKVQEETYRSISYTLSSSFNKLEKYKKSLSYMDVRRIKTILREYLKKIDILLMAIEKKNND